MFLGILFKKFNVVFIQTFTSNNVSYSVTFRLFSWASDIQRAGNINKK